MLKNFNKININSTSIIEETDDLEDVSVSYFDKSQRSNLDLNKTMTNISTTMEQQFRDSFVPHTSFKLKQVVKASGAGFEKYPINSSRY